MNAIITNKGLKIDMKNGTLGSSVTGVKIRIEASNYVVPNFGDIPVTYTHATIIFYNIITNSIVLGTVSDSSKTHYYELCRWVVEDKKWIGNDGNIQITLRDADVPWDLSRVLYLSKANNVGYLVIDRINKTITIPANLSFIYSDDMGQSWLTTAQVLNYSTLATSRTLYLYYNKTTGTFIYQRDNVKPANTNDELYFVTSFYNNVNNSSTISFNNACIRVIEDNEFRINKITFLGDSNTQFNFDVGFPQTVKRILGQELELVNMGVSGAKLISGFPTSMSLRIAQMPSDTTILMIIGGTNDEESPVGTIQPIGSTFDDTTVYGAYQKIIEIAYSINPKVAIFPVVPFPEYKLVGGEVVEVDKSGVLNAVRDVSKLYNIKPIDLDAEMGINVLNQAQYFYDYTHLTEFGGEEVGRLFGNFIKDNY